MQTRRLMKPMKEGMIRVLSEIEFNKILADSFSLTGKQFTDANI